MDIWTHATQREIGGPAVPRSMGELWLLHRAPKVQVFFLDFWLLDPTTAPSFFHRHCLSVAWSQFATRHGRCWVHCKMQTGRPSFTHDPSYDSLRRKQIPCMVRCPTCLRHVGNSNCVATFPHADKYPLLYPSCCSINNGTYGSFSSGYTNYRE